MNTRTIASLVIAAVVGCAIGFAAAWHWSPYLLGALGGTAAGLSLYKNWGHIPLTPVR